MAGADRTFDEGKPLRAGAAFEGIVVAHHRWGAEIEIEAAGISGIVDLRRVLDDRPFQGPADFPEIGAEVKGVVLGYTPNGQLRLSLLREDVAAAADARDLWEQVEGALRSDNPGLALRSVFKRLIDSGIDREVVLRRMKGWVLRLREEGRDEDEDVVLDVADLVVGFSGPVTRL